MRRRAVVVAQSFGGRFEMPRDNFHERIEVDGRGAVEAVVVVHCGMARGEVPAVGKGLFYRRLRCRRRVCTLCRTFARTSSDTHSRRTGGYAGNNRAAAFVLTTV